MPIEIRELIIKATVVDQAESEGSSRPEPQQGQAQDGLADKIEAVIQLIKEKNER